MRNPIVEEILARTTREEMMFVRNYAKAVIRHANKPKRKKGQRHRAPKKNNKGRA